MEKYHTIKVSSIMNFEYYSVEPYATIDEAVKLMSENDTSLLVVAMKGKFPVGMLTERDILIRVLGGGKKPSETLVEEIMTRPVSICKPDTPITDAMRLMAKNRVRQLLVVKNGLIMGIFQARDALNIAPDLIDLLAELVLIRGKEDQLIREGISGHCDKCKAYSDELRMFDGQYLCKYCRDALGFEE
ncbi:MAG: cyclic nucleotide-binding/CBS domain-containing protein [Promethearchaeota archaeon]